jgi:hypothetical protein
MRARYYDPAIGRFASEDPRENGNNWYCYCEDSPVVKVDVDGKKPIADIVSYFIGVGVFSGLTIAGVLIAGYGCVTRNTACMIIGTVMGCLAGYLDYVCLKQLCGVIDDLKRRQNQEGARLDQDIYDTTRVLKGMGVGAAVFGHFLELDYSTSAALG